LGEWNPMGPHRDFDGLEFSDYGRNSRFVSGWWIIPGLVIGSMILIACVAG